MAFVLVLVGPILRWLPRGGRLVAGFVVLLTFAAMTRFEPSVLRACAMAACSMTAIAVGRPTAGLRVLALAAIVLCAVDPFLAYSVGFQLSFLATAGIAVLGPGITRRVPGPRWWRESLGVTLGAQIAVAPLLLATFGAVPLVAVPANLVAAPLVGPLTLCGLASGVVGSVVGADVAVAVVGLPAYAGASAVLAVAHTAAVVPVALGPREAVLAGAFTAIAFAGRWARRATWRRARSVAVDRSLAVPPR